MATWINLLDIIYPVDSIYQSMNSTSPASIIGGTWSAISGRFLLGANSTYTAGSQDGAASVTLTVNQIPSHTHSGTRTITSTLSQNYEGRENFALSGQSVDTIHTFNDWTNATGGGNRIQICRPISLFIFGEEQHNSRGDVEWPTSTFCKSSIPLALTISQELQQAHLPLSEVLGLKLAEEDSYVRQVVAMPQELVEAQKKLHSLRIKCPNTGTMSKKILQDRGLIAECGELMPVAVVNGGCPQVEDLKAIPDWQQHERADHNHTRTVHHILSRIFGNEQLKEIVGGVV